MHARGGHARRVVSPALVELAEDPGVLHPASDQSQWTSCDSYCVIIGPHRRWAGVCRLRLPHCAEAVARAVDEIPQLINGIDLVVRNVGSSATPETSPDGFESSVYGTPTCPCPPLRRHGTRRGALCGHRCRRTPDRDPRGAPRGDGDRAGSSGLGAALLVTNEPGPRRLSNVARLDPSRRVPILRRLRGGIHARMTRSPHLPMRSARREAQPRPRGVRASTE